MLSHFVAVQDFAGAQSDILFTEAAFLHRCSCGNLLQFLFGGGQKLGAFAGAFFGQQGIEAGDKALAGKIRMGISARSVLSKKESCRPPSEAIF